MKNNGYIKLHRKIWDNPLLRRSGFMLIWIYLLTHATHKKYDVVFGGARITLNPGQLITGRKAISRATKIHESSVQRILRVLEIKEGQIEQRTDRQNRLITVVNWEKYQVREQRVNNARTTSEQRVNTNKKVKNDKNVKKYNATSKDVVDIEKIFDIFYKSINPTINWGNKTNRKAAQDLIKKFGIEKTIRMTEYAISIQNKKFAPTITTPYQLKEKLSQLMGYYQREGGGDRVVKL